MNHENNDDFDRNIKYLINQVNNNRLIFFTGAGFSLCAINQFGERLPSGKSLAEKLWNRFFPGEDFDGSLLKDVFEACKKRKKSEVKSFLIDTFSVNYTNLPDFYKIYFSVPWSDWFTLNIDNIEEAANLKFDLPIKYRPLSYKLINEIDDIKQESFNVLHANGTLNDLPDDVTFTEIDYADRNIEDTAYSIISAKIIIKPTVFLGTELDESTFWKYIQCRRIMKNKSSPISTIIPKSFLVSPEISKAKEKILPDYGIIYLKMTAEEFAEKYLMVILDKIEGSYSDLRKKRRSQSSHNTLETIPLIADIMSISDGTATQYLIGAEPKWSDLLSSRAIEREVDNESYNQSRVLISDDEKNHLLLINGTAGSGKSSSIMRLGLRLSSDGRNCGWVGADVNISPRNMINSAVTELGQKSYDCILIDDADRYGDALNTIIDKLCSENGPKLLIISMRSSKVDNCISESIRNKVQFHQISMPNLSNEDIVNLIGLLEREKRLGVLANRELSEQIGIFRDKAQRQLLVAMIEATSGRKFEEKVIEEYEELSPFKKAIYSIVSIVSSYNYAIPRDELIQILGELTNEALASLRDLASTNILVVDKYGCFKARHRIIAEKITDHLKSIAIFNEFLSKIIFVLASRIRPNMTRDVPQYRLLIRLINNEYLFRNVGLDKARIIYQEIQELMHKDYHYWLQRGSLEVSEGDLYEAENFLNQAKQYKQDDDYVLNEWALLCFRQAINNPTGDHSKERVKEAIDILVNQIKFNERVREHSFHILGSQIISWTKAPQLKYYEKIELYELAKNFVEKGLQRFPRSDKLKQLYDDLNRNYMMLAVDMEATKKYGIIPKQ